ncbi:hypothetical protein HCUR_00729 [Holospora curviuscula]|uniref:Uncharacterized protein n=1 Tax=Holospora curviuscula TaxID=1082868 RepID=A0A2S5R933_9PROT|nr:hypothetical protein HCUR_00729 [Holospora curviuscula]
MTIKTFCIFLYLGLLSTSLCFAKSWESLASHINTEIPPGELTKEVNDLLHQTFDKKA